MTIALSLKKGRQGPVLKRAVKGSLFSDVCYIIMSYSLMSDLDLSHVAIPAKTKRGLSTQMRTGKDNYSVH